jgi:hypothetical protein
LVSISSSGCEITAVNESKNTIQARLFSGRLKQAAINATSKANVIECVKPRCPHYDEYAMPNLKPTVSISGNIAQKAEKISKRRLTCLPTPKLVAMGTAMCEKIVGIFLS